MKRLFVSKSLIALFLLASLGACKDIDALPKHPDELKELVDKAKEAEKKKEEDKNSDSNKEQEQNKEDKSEDEDDKAKSEEGETPNSEDKDEDKQPNEEGETPNPQDKDEDNQPNEEGETPNSEDKDEDSQPNGEGETPNSEDKDEDSQPNGEAKFAKPAKLNPVFYVKFTGQLCLYCPQDTRITVASQNRYGKDKYVYAALHSEARFSLLNKPQVSLYSKEAEEYRRNITGNTGLPDGYYGRLGKTFSPLSDLSVKEMFNEPDLLACQGRAKALSKGQLQINLKTWLRSDRKDFIKGKKVHMLLWILENDVQAYQQDGEKKPYHSFPKHQHIFRSSLNGHWGEAFEVGNDYEKTFSVPESVGKIENCEIIVLFLEHDTKIVLDAGCFKVK